MPEAARTLVKSPPELWAEVSDPESLARHLGDVGEIRITRMEPESTVAWEGNRIRGTVDLAPAGWGTKVTVTAEDVEDVEDTAVAPPAEDVPQAAAKPEEPVAAVPAPAQPVAVAPPESEPEPEPESRPRRGLRARLDRWFGRKAPAAEPEPAPDLEPTVEFVAIAEPEPEPEPEPGPDPAAPDPAPVPDTAAVLDGMLGSLGSAHHRPFSR
jgi:hypothetical protein